MVNSVVNISSESLDLSVLLSKFIVCFNLCISDENENDYLEKTMYCNWKQVITLSIYEIKC